jgi:phosphohistidine phosphatase
MKFLTVVRHAKSSWDQPHLLDHDRPLNARGLAAAPAIAKFLSVTYFGAGNDAPLMTAPDALVSSTAARTLATSEHLLTHFKLRREQLALDSRLYLATAATILEVVRGLDESARHAVVVGHNPGLHDFCNRLLSRAAIPKMPTATAVIMSLPHAYWGLADWQEAQLIAYLTPKALERRFPSEYKGISSMDAED